MQSNAPFFLPSTRGRRPASPPPCATRGLPRWYLESRYHGAQLIPHSAGSEGTGVRGRERSWGGKVSGEGGGHGQGLRGSPGGALHALRLRGGVSTRGHPRAPHARRQEGGSARAGPQSRCPPPAAAEEASSARGFLESPPASPRDPGPHCRVVRRASSFLGSGFPGTHPVPTPQSWRPAWDARRPGGRPAKFRVPLQETGRCVPDSGKPAVWAPDPRTDLSPPPTPSAWDVSAG